MKAIPRRLLILGGGPVGVEIAQAVRRFGGGVAIIDRSTHVLAREPAPLGEALSVVLTCEGKKLLRAGVDGAARGCGLCGGARRRRELCGDRLLVATGLRAIGNVTGIWRLTKSGSIRAMSSPRTSSVSPARQTMGPFGGSPIRTRKPRPWAPLKAASAPRCRCRRCPKTAARKRATVRVGNTGRDLLGAAQMPLGRCQRVSTRRVTVPPRLDSAFTDVTC
jgi:hypothetical protein